MCSLRCLVAVSAFLCVLATGASPARAYTWHITGPEAKGGVVDFFLAQIELARKNKIKVVLSRECWSSCTLYTSLLREGLLCAAPGTKLGFHQYVSATDMVVEGGVLKSFKNRGPVTGPAFDRIWNTYPASIRRAIIRHGGLPPHGRELILLAKDLGVPTC